MTIHRVALVDDDSDIRALGSLSLRNVGGGECVLFGSAAEVHAGLRQAAADVVLLDVTLGDADGVAVLAELRASGFDTPVIFVTGSIQQADMARYGSSGVLGVIAKPFNPLTLAAQVQQLFGAAAV